MQNKRKQSTDFILDIPDTGMCEISGKQVDNLHVYSSALSFIINSVMYLGTSVE
jgi:hypothetical protein